MRATKVSLFISVFCIDRASPARRAAGAVSWPEFSCFQTHSVRDRRHHRGFGDSLAVEREATCSGNREELRSQHPPNHLHSSATGPFPGRP